MAKGCCGGAECGCRILPGVDAQGNASVGITGTGTAQSPFIITGAAIQGIDTLSIDFTITFDPATKQYNVTAGLASTSKLDQFGDVTAPAPTNNQVLGWDSATNQWTPRAPTSAAAGAVNHNDSLTGDGSAGSPLQVRHGDGYTATTTGSGVRFTTLAINSLIRRFATVADRVAASPAPQLNTISITEDRPGLFDYWDGSNWATLLILTEETGVALFEQSGDYEDNSPTQGFNSLVNDVSDDDGRITLMSASVEPLASAAGVLDANFTLASGYPYMWGYDTSLGDLDIIVYQYDSGSGSNVPATGVAVKGKLRALLY